MGAQRNFRLNRFPIQPILLDNPKIQCKKVKVDMKARLMLVYLAVLFAMAGPQAGACKAGSTSMNARHAEAVAAELSVPAPAALRVVGTPLERHLFPVMDDKGLLLSCVAPELGTNHDTDVFENCTLAPGRTLDDVMHSLVKAIHEEQHERVGNDAQQRQGATENPEQKNARN
jgi:hypothetical protein